VLSLAAQGAQFVLQFTSTVVLARLLTTADFGLVAMVTAITAMAAGFADLGLTEATIQRKDITHEQVSTLFWINVSLGLFLSLVTAALAPVLVWFYKEPRLLNITLVVSVSFLIGGLRGQHNALLKRQMRFFAVAIRDVTAYAIAVPVAILMALHGAGYWAIVALPLTLNLVQLIMTWLLVDWRPGLPRRSAHVWSMVGFGGNVAASYVIFNWIRNADNILIGWYWGAAPLGLYSRAYNLLMQPVSQLTAPVASVAIPAFSRIHDDRELFARYYLRVSNLIMWVSAPLFAFLFVAAKPAILLALGGKWRDAVPVFQILTISALAQILLETTLWLFVSRGQSSRLLKLMLIISPIIVGSFVIGLPFNIRGVAISLTVVLLISLPWILHFTFRGTDLTLLRLGRALMCPVLMGVAGVLFAELAQRLLVVQPNISQLLVIAVGFLVAYALSAALPQVRNEFMSLTRLLKDLRPAGEARA
jgi:PST family polysaccharide transporter